MHPSSATLPSELSYGGRLLNQPSLNLRFRQIFRVLFDNDGSLFVDVVPASVYRGRTGTRANPMHVQ